MLATQYGLFGEDRLTGDVVAQIKDVLADEPATRNHYGLLAVRIWRRFHGLDAAIGCMAAEALEQFIQRRGLPGMKTIQNRAMEIQHENERLDATATVRSWRDKQATAGRVR
jgi:hypothetical protein